MPSPFPGMDPFLEHPGIFPDLHDRLIANVSDFLQARLPPPYFAAIGQRAWIEVSRRIIGPDVEILRPSQRPRGVPTEAGGVAIATDPRTHPVVVTVPHDEFRETLVEIRVRQGEGELVVTTFEVLSPSNKAPGEQGRDLYLRKQREILDSKTHLVEIDLLRGGTHATAVPRDLAVALAGPFDYHVSVHRFDRFEDFFVYPIRLEERLPEIAVPLLPGDPDVPLDLQAVFDRCYDTGPYRRRVRYDESTPVPALGTEQAEWVAGRLAQAAEATG